MNQQLKNLFAVITATLVTAPVQAAEPVGSKTAAPSLPFVPGKMTTLAELSSSQSKVFQLSDPDRPGA